MLPASNRTGEAIARNDFFFWADVLHKLWHMTSHQLRKILFWCDCGVERKSHAHGYVTERMQSNRAQSFGMSNCVRLREYDLCAWPL